MFLLFALACGPSKEELKKEILESEELKQLIQQQVQTNPNELNTLKTDVTNLNEMAGCLSKIGGVQSYRVTKASSVRKCAKKGTGEE